MFKVFWHTSSLYSRMLIKSLPFLWTVLSIPWKVVFLSYSCSQKSLQKHMPVLQCSVLLLSKFKHVPLSHVLFIDYQHGTYRKEHHWRTSTFIHSKSLCILQINSSFIQNLMNRAYYVSNILLRLYSQSICVFTRINIRRYFSHLTHGETSMKRK